MRKAYRTTEQPLPSLSWQLDGLELNKTVLDTVEAKKLAQRLREVTGQTDHYFSQDVRVTARLLAYLLAFESHQQGFGLTATQDAHFNEVGSALCPLFHGADPQLHGSFSLTSSQAWTPSLLPILTSGKVKVLPLHSSVSSPALLPLGPPLLPG